MDEEVLELPSAKEGEEIVLYYASTGLILRRHPFALLPERLKAKGYRTKQQFDRRPTEPTSRLSPPKKN